VDIGWDDWIRTRVGPVRSSQVMHDRPWATVTQVTTAEEIALVQGLRTDTEFRAATVGPVIFAMARPRRGGRRA
jgi:hypothetical protein